MFSLLPFLSFWLLVQEGHHHANSPTSIDVNLNAKSNYHYENFGQSMRSIEQERDAVAVTQATFYESQIEECLPQVTTLLISAPVLTVEEISKHQREQQYQYSKQEGYQRSSSQSYYPQNKNNMLEKQHQQDTLYQENYLRYPSHHPRSPAAIQWNRWVEAQVLEHCTVNVHLALKTYWLLHAALGNLEFKSRASLPQISKSKENKEHLIYLLRNAESLAECGKDSPICLSKLRRTYFLNCNIFIGSLVRLGLDLIQTPVPKRMGELQSRLQEVNNWLSTLMHTRGKIILNGTPNSPGEEHKRQPYFFGKQHDPYDHNNSNQRTHSHMNPTAPIIWIDPEITAKLCPDIAQHSIHLPLTDCSGPCLRFLRIVTEECEVLPSRERTPYLIVAELLQPDAYLPCGSSKVFTSGSKIGCSVRDVLEGRKFPSSLIDPSTSYHSNVFHEHLNSRSTSTLSSIDKNVNINSNSNKNNRETIKRNTELENNRRNPMRPIPPRTERNFIFNDHHSNGGYGFLNDVLNQEGHTLWTTVFGELWQHKSRRIRAQSPFGSLPGWRLASFIVKAGDDLRQEQLAMQFITLVQEIFKQEHLDLWLRPYQILCVGNQAGLIEAVADAKSIDVVKKRTPNFTTLRDYFERMYGNMYSPVARRAQFCFAKSLAAYSVIMYLLQVKDRHNANILLDKAGHIIHIDYGFMLGQSPGSIKFETAPFKLPADYVDLMGGPNEPAYELFRTLMIQAFESLNKPRHRARLLDLLNVSIADSPEKASVMKAFVERLDATRTPAGVLSLIADSSDNWRTRMYDTYQKRTNGIL